MILFNPRSKVVLSHSAFHWRCFILVVFARLLICVSIGAQDLIPASVVSFHELSTLDTNRALTGLSVKVKCVVVFVDLERNQLYVHDGAETASFDPRRFQTQPILGSAIEITGLTTLVEGKPALSNLKLSVLGVGILPVAKQRELSELANDYGQWIEIAGRIRVAETSTGRLRLSVQGSEQKCIVSVAGQTKIDDFRSLMDRNVRIRGVNAGQIVSGGMTSAVVFAPGLDYITMLNQPDTDPLAGPAVAIANLLNRELDSWTNNRVHVSGLVSTYVPGEYLMVKDPTGFIRAQITQVEVMKPNERVEVWGFLKTSAAGPVLEDVYFARTMIPAQSVASSIPRLVSQLPIPFETLTNIADIRKLRREDAARGFPIRLRGVITYADPDWKNAFIQDSSGAIYFTLDQKEIRPGQWVELTGQTSPGGFATESINSNVQILGTTNLPPALKVDFQEVANGKLDSHWIEMEGVVRRLDQEGGHAFLTVVTRNGKFKALVPGLDDHHPPNHLIDSLVSVQGACGSEMNPQRQLIGITLHVPSLNEIQILNPAPTDPFAVESILIGAVATFDPDRLVGRRLKISGVVTLTVPGDGFVLQDASGGIRVHTKQTNELHAGQSMEVLGFPEIGGFASHFEEGTFRVVQHARAVEPKRIKAEEILLQGTYDQTLVRVNARLMQRVPRSARPELLLHDGSIIFTARLQASMPGADFSGLKPGSLLELTGVCSMQGSEEREPSGFRLLLRQPEDIKLLKSPPWWMDSRVLWVAGGLLAVVLITITWGAMLAGKNKLLNRTQGELHKINDELESRVEQRTQDLKQEVAVRQRSESVLRTLIDNLPVYIYIKDINGRFVVSNLPHTKLRGVTSESELVGKTVFDFCPPEIAKQHDADDQTVLRSGQPVIAREELAGIGDECTCHSTTKIPLRDIAGNITGLVGISQDITERKRAEADLEKAHRELLETSRQAGMAEVATGVLHNVGNVLNSVNVSSSCVMDRIKNFKINSLSRVVALLRGHEGDLGGFVTNDPRGKQLPDFLAILAGHLSNEQAETLKELAHLQKNIEHIKDIITMQQGFAKVSGVSETLKPDDLVEDALRMNATGLARHRIQVIKEFKDVPPITVEKHKVIQILVNLIRNAKHACNASGRPSRELTVRVANGDGRVRISVSDNGVGIPVENLTRIFNHGFTTKEDGHGFGLHSGALAAKELGGSLNVHSAGAGEGATFTLELPSKPIE